MKRTDGGQGMFSEAAITNVSRRQRFSEVLHESVLEPARIAWSDWRTKVGLSIIFAYVVVGLIAWISASNFLFLDTISIVETPYANQGPTGLEPFQNWDHPLGTDQSGRDLLTAVVHATPMMLQMILAGAVFATVMATVIGTVAGYKGGRTEAVLMTFTDIMMTIPGLPLVIVVIVLVEPNSAYVIGIVLTINAWAGLARTIHSQVLTIREHSYVEASRTMGISTPRIIRKDILPNLMPYITVNFVFSARRVIYDGVALYFIGILSFSTVENWGVMMNLAYYNASALIVPSRSYMLIVPMMAIVILSFGLILFAQGTDRLFNPRVRTRQAGETVEEDDDDENISGAFTQ